MHGFAGGPWIDLAPADPRTRDDVASELEDYKAHLEAEIRALERRMKALRSAPE
jgi:hypothetical protein